MAEINTQSSPSQTQGNRPKIQRVWLITAAPVLCFAIVTLLAFILLNAVTCGVESSSCVPNAPRITVPPANASFDELTSRLTWGISVLFVALTVMVTIGVVFITLFVVNDQIIRVLLQMTIICALPVLYILEATKTTYAFNRQFLDMTVYSRVTDAKPIVSAVEAGGHTVLIGLSLSIAAILFRAARNVLLDDSTNFQKVAATVANHHRSIRTLLYFGTFTLIAGTLESSALYSWAHSIFDAGDYIRQGVKFSVVMSALTGAFYSLFLAAIFVPGFALLRWIAGRLADTANPDATVEERAKWIADNSLNISLPRDVVSAIAVLGPLIMGGPAVSMLQAFIN